MSKRRPAIDQHYAATLRQFLGDQQEALLEQAYVFGRAVIAKGAGVLEMVRIHQQALQKVFPPTLPKNELERAAVTFFFQALSPFEAAYRGFLETNLRLKESVTTLEKRNVELARSNRELAREIQQRKQTERALRKSKEHLRALFIEARRMEENLRNLSNQVLHAHEEERKRISRELHDEVGQALTAVSVTLATLKGYALNNPSLLVAKIADTQNLLQESMESVHGFAREMRPTILDELGLVPALRSCLKAFGERTGLLVRLSANSMVEQLTSEQKIVLFRVAQESLTNVAKHAKASRVDVILRKTGAGVRMEVIDNGQSFRDSMKHKSKKRLGLLGMQERVHLVNGTFAITPELGRGTTIRVVIPLTPPSATLPPRQLQGEGHVERSAALGPTSALKSV